MRCYLARKLPGLSPDEVDARIEEALKFLNIAVYCRGNIPVSQEIDDVWHYWILETVEYARLCDRLEGRRFIHHSSNIYARCAEDRDAPEEYDLQHGVSILATYVLNYGAFEEDRIRYWPLAEHLVDNCGMTVPRLNEWLLSGFAPTTRSGR